jgi:hypothetical protein
VDTLSAVKSSLTEEEYLDYLEGLAALRYEYMRQGTDGDTVMEDLDEVSGAKTGWTLPSLSKVMTALKLAKD